MPVRQRVSHRDPHHPLAGALDTVGRRGAPIIIDADHRRPARLHGRHQALLHGGVIVACCHGGRDGLAQVDQHADRGIERRRQIDLKGRALDHIGTAGARWLQRQDRGADIAADLRVRAGGFEQVGDQRRGSGFAVGPGNGDERGVGRMQPPFAAKQLDVADHLNAGRLGKACGPVRGRVG